jgi:hypothetical protein
MLNGHQQSISVNATVGDAEVLLDGQPIGLTPLTVQVERHKKGTLTVRKEGYTSVQLQMNSNWSNAFIWGDIVAWGIFLGTVPGLISTTVDSGTEAMYEYAPSNYYADLRPASASAEPSPLERKRAALIAFCLSSYQSIRREMAQGTGEHLEALCQLTDMEQDCFKQSHPLGDILHTVNTAPAFANAVAKLALQTGQLP